MTSVSVVKKERDVSIDVAKGIGIICVIIGHCHIEFVGAFHMILFFVLSGYFMSNKLTEKQFALKRAKQLLIPYVFGVCLTIVGAVVKDLIFHENSEMKEDILKWFWAGLYGKGTKEDILIPNVHKIGAYWFLLAMFLGSVIVRKFLDYEHMLVILAVIAYVGYATRQVMFLPLSIQNGMVAAFFLGIGYYARKEKVFEKKPDKAVVIALLCLWVYITYNKIYMSMAALKFPNGLLHVVGGIAITYLIVLISKWIADKCHYLRKFLVFMGTNTLIILCFHAFEINIIRWGWCHELCERVGLAYMGTALEFLCRTIFCIVCVLIVNRTKYLKKIFK